MSLLKKKKRFFGSTLDHTPTNSSSFDRLLFPPSTLEPCPLATLFSRLLRLTLFPGKSYLDTTQGVWRWVWGQRQSHTEKEASCAVRVPEVETSERARTERARKGHLCQRGWGLWVRARYKPCTNETSIYRTPYSIWHRTNLWYVRTLYVSVLCLLLRAFWWGCGSKRTALDLCYA